MADPQTVLPRAPTYDDTGTARSRRAGAAGGNQLPPRFPLPLPRNVLLLAAFLGFLLWSGSHVRVSLAELWRGLPGMLEHLGEMFPPALERIRTVAGLVLETLQMATVGCTVGVLCSVPVAFFAARNHSPNRITYLCTRGFVTMLRTVPDLVWALLFIVWVGLGPFAGVLTLIVETIGFCGRFFADAFEDTDQGPAEALTAMGAKGASIFTCATFPAALPSMTNTALYALEKAVRASVVLGLVGAGGIGVELKTAMEMFKFGQASTIILFVFAMVFAVERTSSWLRSKI